MLVASGEAGYIGAACVIYDSPHTNVVPLLNIDIQSNGLPLRSCKRVCKSWC